jgi:Ni/Fe-hydrogenase 1 B-type cytochrome subunit
MLKRVYVWEAPMRATHWVNFAVIGTLSFTGLYMGNPFLRTPEGEVFYMATARFTHFLAAYVLTVSWLTRLYWAFAGNGYSRLGVFFFYNRERRKEMWEDLKFYLFIGRRHPTAVGHTPLGSLAYLFVFLILLGQIITGFSLYAQSHYGLFATLMGGWLPAFVALPTIRLIHHSLMWLLIWFVIMHIYMAWLNDRSNKDFCISSIFTGYKGVYED